MIPFAILALILSSSAKADILNRQLIPIGESEAFMGNTGTGRATDAGAVFYNPAGLSAVEGSSVSATGSVYLSTDTKADALLQVGSTQYPYEAKSYTSIPSTFAAVKKYGEWTLGFSALVPDFGENDSSFQFPVNSATFAAVYSVKHNDLWLGLSAAHALSDTWSLGFTLFGVNHTESAVSSASLSDPTRNVASTSLNRTYLSAKGLVLALGAHGQLQDWFGLGLRVQTPFLKIAGNAEILSQSTTTSSGIVTPTLTDKKDLEGNYHLPLDMTIGTDFRVSALLEFLFDISYQLGAHYESIPGASNSSIYNTDPTLRYNFGAEYVASKDIRVQLGFFYNPSSIHDVANYPAGTEKDDYFGVTGGLSLGSKNVRTGIGAFYAWANGTLIPLGTGNGPVKEEITAFGGLLTTAYLF